MSTDTQNNAPVSAEPVAWVRRHPDGALTAEFLEHAVIEPVRKNSGAWVPLYTAPVPAQAQPDAVRHEHDWVQGPYVTDTMGSGWCVRIDGTDIFADLNRYGCKGRVTFQISHGLSSKEEAEAALAEWLRKTTPVATQPDVTQQTLDDVMAGIPARDAEIEALRKEIEVLQAQLVDRPPEMQGKPVDESPILQGQQQPASDADGLPLILHDLNTSAGGRGFVAEYFESRVGRYDFTRYIRDRLAADFACALAAHLSQQDVLQAEVLDMVRMLEANEWTDHCGQSELGKRLWWAITALQNRPQNIPEIIPEPAQRLIFPTMLRKMWSGSEVQAWLDDELAKLTKLSSQQVTDKTDAGQDYNDGFSDGVILALQLMTMHGDYNGTQYCELFNAAGPNQIVERAIREGMWEMSGLSQTPAAVERRAAIEAARKENSNA